MRLLIVEDDKSLAAGLEKLMNKNGYETDVVDNGVDGLDYGLSEIYDCIVLDIMLPQLDGLAVVQRLRESGVNTPILLLTAKNEQGDCARGLDSGADDYLTKPFDIAELLARLRALTRRRDRVWKEKNPVFGDLLLDREHRELCRGEQRVHLSPKEFQLMECLMTHESGVVSTRLLQEKVWGSFFEGEYNSLEVYVTYLRRKLRELGSCVAVRFVRGAGYCLEAAA